MRRKLIYVLASIAAALVWAFACQDSMAEVVLSGTPDRLVLRANDATIGEAVAALRSASELEIDLKGSSPHRLAGVYAGSMRQVLSRLLKDENYVMRSTPGRITIRLLTAGGSERSAVAAPAGPPPGPGSRLIALRRGDLKRTDSNP
jgi:hypothetical protein